MTTFDGDIDGDGQFEKLYALGARSFSIWTEDGRNGSPLLVVGNEVSGTTTIYQVDLINL